MFYLFLVNSLLLSALNPSAWAGSCANQYKERERHSYEIEFVKSSWDGYALPQRSIKIGRGANEVRTLKTPEELSDWISYLAPTRLIEFLSFLVNNQVCVNKKRDRLTTEARSEKIDRLLTLREQLQSSIDPRKKEVQSQTIRVDLVKLFGSGALTLVSDKSEEVPVFPSQKRIMRITIDRAGSVEIIDTSSKERQKEIHEPSKFEFPEPGAIEIDPNTVEKGSSEFKSLGERMKGIEPLQLNWFTVGIIPELFRRAHKNLRPNDIHISNNFAEYPRVRIDYKTSQRKDGFNPYNPFGLKGEKADVYALASILFEMMSGKRPIEVSNYDEVSRLEFPPHIRAILTRYSRLEDLDPAAAITDRPLIDVVHRALNLEYGLVEFDRMLSKVIREGYTK